MSIIICIVHTFLEVYAKKLVQNVNELVGWVRGKGFWDNAKTKQIIFLPESLTLSVKVLWNWQDLLCFCTNVINVSFFQNIFG